MKFITGIIISFVFIITCDAIMYVSYDGYGPTWIAYIVLPMKYFAIFILIYIAIKKKWQTLIPKKIFVLFLILLGWNIFTIFKGAFSAKDYYDWKFFFDTSFPFLLIPLAMIIGIYLTYAKRIFSITLKYLFFFGFILIPLALVTNIQLYARIMIPVSVFIIISPFLKTKWRILILFVAVASILSALAFRTNIIRILASLLLIIAFQFRNYLKTGTFKLAHLLLFLAPSILLYLAITGQFNVFKFQEKDEKYNTSDSKGGTRNLLEDTRTFLYAEVITSLYRNQNLVLGEGAIGKYESNFYDFGDNRGRYMSEVGFLNTLLFSGIIGALIFLIFIFTVSFYALYRSNNWLCKIFGLYIAFRWILFFVEEFTIFDLNFFFYWIILGLISTNEFRSMNDSEVKCFFKEI